jgi:hypothetical protein
MAARAQPSPTSRAAGKAAWQEIKDRVHAYARAPSAATASGVQGAFRALREPDRASAQPRAAGAQAAKAPR